MRGGWGVFRQADRPWQPNTRNLGVTRPKPNTVRHDMFETFQFASLRQRRCIRQPGVTGHTLRRVAGNPGGGWPPPTVTLKALYNPTPQLLITSSEPCVTPLGYFPNGHVYPGLEGVRSCVTARPPTLG